MADMEESDRRLSCTSTLVPGSNRGNGLYRLNYRIPAVHLHELSRALADSLCTRKQRDDTKAER